MTAYKGSCHCSAIQVELESGRAPNEQIVGACQCSFCRKHNARAFSDPKAKARLIARQPEHVHEYTFGLKTARAIVCSRCGVYVAMVLADGDETLSVINIDTLDDRAEFTGEAQSRDYSTETVEDRIARRKSNWTPTELIDWPEAGGAR